MARKLDYKTCKKLLNDLSTNTQDKQYIDELLKINNCNLEEFSKGKLTRHFISKASHHFSMYIILKWIFKNNVYPLMKQNYC